MEISNMRIIYLGGGEFGCPSLRWLNESPHNILQVFTGPARPAGRGKKLRPTPIAQLAAELLLPCREESDVNHPTVLDDIIKLRPDVIVVIAFGQKIGPALLSLTDCRVINVHSSLLPAFRGAAPINWAIINGASQTGITIIELNQVWDGGAILAQTATDIRPTETAGQLHDRLAALAPPLLENLIDNIASGAAQAIAQDETKASQAPKLSKADAAIKWNTPAPRIANLINGMSPWPGAYCLLAQPFKSPERITIARAEVVAPDPPADASLPPGSLDENLHVICGAGRLRLLEVKPASGRLMSFPDLVNGRRITADNRFLDG